MRVLAGNSVPTPRRRRYVGRAALRALRPLFRYSDSRDAYVLRGIGSRVGPVLRARDE